jgi:hypothetical protein
VVESSPPAAQAAAVAPASHTADLQLVCRGCPLVGSQQGSRRQADATLWGRLSSAAHWDSAKPVLGRDTSRSRLWLRRGGAGLGGMFMLARLEMGGAASVDGGDDRSRSNTRRRYVIARAVSRAVGVVWASRRSW